MPRYQFQPLVIPASNATPRRAASRSQPLRNNWPEKLRQIEALCAELGNLEIEYLSVEDESCAIFHVPDFREA